MWHFIGKNNIICCSKYMKVEQEKYIEIIDSRKVWIYSMFSNLIRTQNRVRIIFAVVSWILENDRAAVLAVRTIQ